MITKTCGEILYNAQVLAGVYNLDFTSFQTSIAILNNIYRTLYNEIANSDSDFYIKDFIFTPDDNIAGVPLPSDLWMIKTVTHVDSNGNSLSIIDRSPTKEDIPGTYRIENNRFKLFGSNSARNIKIRYVPVPQTVTAPRENEIIDLDSSTILEVGRMFEEGFYFKNLEGIPFFYDFATKTADTTASWETQPADYLDKELVVDISAQTITHGGDDITDLFYWEGQDFIKVVWDSPYLMVTYRNNDVRVFNYFSGTSWNILASTGHDTKGTVLAMKTNDKTGWGCIFLDKTDSTLYRAPFVPDTVMNYPTNSFFALMECAIANQLMSMAGLQNQYLSSVLTAQAENEFINELRQNRASPVRMNNFLKTRRVY